MKQTQSLSSCRSFRNSTIYGQLRIIAAASLNAAAPGSGAIALRYPPEAICFGFVVLFFLLGGGGGGDGRHKLLAL